MMPLAILIGVFVVVGYPCHRWAVRRQREWDAHCESLIVDDPHVVAFRRRRHT